MSLPTPDRIPQVSVVIPVHNGEEFLADAIESVLAQTYPSYELIVVDDGSTDHTREIVQSYPGVQYLYQAQRGPAAARNRGIRAAHGEYLAFLDADDLWMPDKLSLQMKAFEMDPALEIVSGQIEQFASSAPETSAARTYAFPEQPIPGYSPIAILIKRTAIEKVGLFDEDDRSAEVIGWLVQTIESNANMLFLPELVARRRIHGKNISITDQQDKNRKMIQILKGSIDRKRTKGTTDSRT
jgi:glycosyltransferase involved in cell wall biosynthesis